MTTTSPTSGLDGIALAPMTGNLTSKDSPNSWFEALSQAWGQTLDNEANILTKESSTISAGMDNPSQITQLTAESLKMSFLSNSSSSSIDSVGKALETMARKG